MIAHIDKVGFESPAQENFAKQSRRAVVSIDMGEDVISRRERMKQPHCCGRASAKSRRCLTAFEHADSTFQRLTIWIVIARVHKTARISALDISLEGGGEVDRCRNRSGGGVDHMSGMDG